MYALYFLNYNDVRKYNIANIKNGGNTTQNENNENLYVSNNVKVVITVLT